MQSPSSCTFRSNEVAIFWRYLSSSLDRLVGMLEGQPAEVLNWRPPAPETNSMYVLANHTVSNAQVNLLGTLCAQLINRNRDSEFTVVTDEDNALDVAWPNIRRELEDALSSLTDDSLDTRYTHHWRGDITGREILLIVARHAAEHLGQAELTCDLAAAALQTGTGLIPVSPRLERQQ